LRLVRKKSRNSNFNRVGPIMIDHDRVFLAIGFPKESPRKKKL
jgi:hypothetical protein